MKTYDQWVDYYSQPENFSNLFADQFRLSAKRTLTDEDRTRLRAATNTIDNKMGL